MTKRLVFDAFKGIHAHVPLLVRLDTEQNMHAGSTLGQQNQPSERSKQSSSLVPPGVPDEGLAEHPRGELLAVRLDGEAALQATLIQERARMRTL